MMGKFLIHSVASGEERYPKGQDHALGGQLGVY